MTSSTKASAKPSQERWHASRTPAPSIAGKARARSRAGVVPDDVAKATHAYSDLEQEYRERSDHDDFEIVLIGADSLDTVHHTRSGCFEKERELIPF